MLSTNSGWGDGEHLAPDAGWSQVLPTRPLVVAEHMGLLSMVTCN
jgi:hypothetical protein